MKKLYITTLLAILFLSLNAQTSNCTWAISGGGMDQDLSSCITNDASCNVYTTGTFWSPSFTIGGITLSNPLYDTTGWFRLGFLTKQNNAGSVVWSKCISTTGFYSPRCSGICTDENGFIYLSGSFSGTIKLDTISLITTHFYGSDLFLVKLDSTGNVIWARKSNSIWASGLHPYAISTDKLGNIYLTGNFWGSSITFDSTTLYCPQGRQYSFIVKYNSSGNVSWAKSITGEFLLDPYDISADTAGNVYVIGNYYSPTITFDSIVLTNSISDSSTSDIFIARYDVSGNIVWAKSFGGMAGELGSSICTGADGYIYATGSFPGSNITFNSTTLTGNGSCANTYIIKFDKNSNIIWGKSFGNSANNNGREISVDTLGNIYVAGDFGAYSYLIIDNFQFYSAGAGDIYVAKFDSLGNTLRATRAGGILFENIGGLSLGSQNTCYITGYYSSPSVVFGIDTLSNDTFSIVNMIYDIYIAKLDFTSSVISPISCDSYISPSCNYTWTSSGTYLDTIPSTAGCDSVITINLTINIVDTSITQTGNTLSANANGASYQWLDCNNGYSIIPGKIYQSFTPTANGSYAVEVTENGCVDTSICYSITNIGIHENSFGEQFEFYPNPTSGKMTVNLGDMYDEIDVTVRNTLGQAVLSKNYKTTNILNFEIAGDKGVYFVEIRTIEGKTAIFKVIIE